MEYFQVRYDSIVVIYERKMFIRLATVFAIKIFSIEGGGVSQRCCNPVALTANECKAELFKRGVFNSEVVY